LVKIREYKKVMAITNDKGKYNPKKRYSKDEVTVSQPDANCMIKSTVKATGKVLSTVKLSPEACKRSKGTATKAEVDAFKAKRKSDKIKSAPSKAYAIAYDNASPADKRKLRLAKGTKTGMSDAQIAKVLGS